MRQSIGAPSRVDIDDQATEHLSNGLVIVPRGIAAKLLTVAGHAVPANFSALLLGTEAMDSPGIIRFVPAGFIDADAVVAWTPDDILASLKDTVERGNADRLVRDLHAQEARRWIQPPHYDRETHQLYWAALVVMKDAPRESDGEIIWHAIGFGREGYVELAIPTSVEKVGSISSMANDFLAGLSFKPGKAYGDASPADPRSAAGLAGAMGLAALHKAPSGPSSWSSETVIPVAAGSVAVVSALLLLVYIQRHRRREARRW